MSLTAESFLWLMAEGKSGREEVWEGLHAQLLLWRWRGPREEEGRQLWGAEGTAPHPQGWLARKQDLIHTTTRNYILPTTWKSSQVDSSPELRDKRPAQQVSWFQALWEPGQSPAEPTRTSDLQSCEIINGCGFQPLSLW